MMDSLYLYLRNLTVREGGQDLVEYAMVVAVIALGATAGMAQVSGGINTVFSVVATTITTAV